jgi:lambda family phage portal protein
MPATRALTPVRRAPVRILGADGRPLAPAAADYFTRRRVLASYDAAQTTNDNTRHWSRADALSADAALTPGIRRTIRNRARYEVANNSYAKGIVLTLANDTMGTGPRLQLLSDDRDANQRVEEAFENWCLATGLARKLRTMRMARAVDGESLALLVTNPNVRHDVQLDVRLIECDRLAEPGMAYGAENVDGVLLDEYGNPRAYRILRSHPGNALGLASTTLYDEFAADYVIHDFRPDRPEQRRGVSELCPALALFANLRRWTLAVLAAAEAAADFAGVVYTEGAPNDQTETEGEPWETIDLERNTFTTLPYGYKLTQIKAEQPTTVYDAFSKALINEIARCLNMPFNVAACNSAGYNYASGRLDYQVYFRSIKVDQSWYEGAALDRILRAWLAEAMFVPGLIPTDWILQGFGLPRHQWFWDGTEHVDPAKEAQAQERRLKNRTTNLSLEYARQGRDWETELRQSLVEEARENEMRAELGLPPRQAAAPTVPDPADQPDEEDA